MGTPNLKAIKLCDEAAILACCAYVDLNPVCAGLAATPEASDFTSAQRRIEPRAGAESDGKPLSPPDGWLAPLPIDEAKGLLGPCVAEHKGASARCSDKGFVPASLDDYLRLLDWTGRHIAPGKRGAIPAAAPPILQHLAI